jgi:hypothetical protein
MLVLGLGKGDALVGAGDLARPELEFKRTGRGLGDRVGLLLLGSRAASAYARSVCHSGIGHGRIVPLTAY